MSQPDTKERILDAAESLFARNGFHNTSLRTITTAADANLAAVNYHFGSKEALVRAVFERRLEPLNRERMEKLEQVAAAPDEAEGLTPGAVLEAFIEPTLQFGHSCPGAADFVVLVGRALHEPDPALRTMFVELMRPVFLRLFDLLCQTLPDLDRNTLFWRLQFALGALGHTLCWSGQMASIERLPEGVQAGPDTASLNELLLTFVTAGMEAS